LLVSANPEKNSVHAVEFLKQPPAQLAPIVVLSGGQRHLKHAVLGVLRKQIIDDDDTSLTQFQGPETTYQKVADELHTVSMWGDCRLVVVEDADDFVSNHRPALEKLVDKPAKKSVLVLNVGSWPKTTRLYKQVAAKGLEVECSELKGPQLLRWLQDTARDSYGKSLTRDAASLMIELVGEEFGLLDSELSKLATYAADKERIDIEDVRALVGGWRTQTTWEMTDATRDHQLGSALNALDRLLTAGEPPIKLLGGITYTFKKFALATELSRNGSLDQALKQAGVFPMAMMPGQNYLRRLGRAKAEQILRHLLETDSGLKGGSPLPERMQLEQLILELAGRV
jgi:DNA polymerase-3 subunit delta